MLETLHDVIKDDYCTCAYCYEVRVFKIGYVYRAGRMEYVLYGRNSSKIIARGVK